MSDISEVYEGAVRVVRVRDIGMVTIRAELEDPSVRYALEAQFGAVPGIRQLVRGHGSLLAWMSPDELLGIVRKDRAASVSGALSDALHSVHALVVDVSDARSVFRLSGEGVRDVLAKGVPQDMSPTSLGQGEIRRTRLGQVATAFWMSGENQIDLVVFRSVSDFVFDWLKEAARPGSLPGYHHSGVST